MQQRLGRIAGLGVALLGPPRLTARGEPLAFRGRPRSLALLGYLLLHRTAHLTRDAVAFALWPDESETDARANLRRHLHHLGTALPASGAPYITAQEDTIRWNPAADVWFDVDEFERLAADADRLDAATAMYGGDLLPGVYDDWVIPIRDRLRRTYLAALETLLRASRSRRDFTAAKAYAGAILVHDPWREDTLRQLASICFESGDRAGALRELDGFAVRLAHEMNVEPMPETLALRARILRGVAGSEPDGQPHEPRPPDSRGPFVGRSAERATLEGAWKRAARGRGDAVFVAGEAGIGKTRLAAELALVVEAQGGRVLRGSTTSPEPLPYAALVEVLRDALPLPDGFAVRPIWLAVLAALLPELALSRDDLPAVPALDPPRERLRLFEALTAVVSALARRRPLLVILEDVHWAGEATLGALEYLARRSAGMPALIVATYRTDSAETPLPALRRRLQLENVSQHVPLGGLDAGAIAELARAIPGLDGREASVALDVHAASGGNPLFAAELLRERSESRATAPGSSLTAMLEARVARLSEGAAVIAGIAGVIGTAFEIDLVRDVCGWGENAVLDALGELLERNLVREVGRARFSFAFTHALIASTIYGTIEPQRRRHWHERVAISMERLAADPRAAAGTLAGHFDAAELPARAAPYYLISARNSFAVFANAEALAAATRALERAPDDAVRFEALALRECIRARLGERAGQRADIDALAELAPFRPDAAAANADICWRRALFARASGDVVAEEQLLSECFTLAHAAGDRAREAGVRCALARNAIAASRYDDARRAARDALERYRALDDAAGEVEALCIVAEVAVNHGTFADVAPALDAAQRRAALTGDPALIVRVTMARATAAINWRDFAQARETAQEALQRYREIGDREGEAEALSRAASAHSMLLRFDEARAQVKLAADIYRSIGNQLKLAYLLFNASSTEMQVGLFDAADASLATALDIFERASDLRGMTACRANLSLIRLQAGDAETARELGARALADARAIQNSVIEAAALANLGNAERELGEFAAALDHMHAAIAIRHGLGLTATFEELADLALAQLAAGDLAAARATADDLLRRAPRSEDNTVWPHYCFWAAACVFRACGAAKPAAEALAHAERLVREQTTAIADETSRAAFLQLRSVRAVQDAARGVWSSG